VAAGPDDEGRDELLRINPKGTVPTLRLGDQALTENVAICSYIADVAPDAALLPADMWQRAHVLSLMSWFASTVHISFRMFRRPERFTEDRGAWENVQDKGLRDFRAHLEKMDGLLSRNEWIAGDSFSIADGYPLVFIQWAAMAELTIDDLVSLDAFRRRMLERPAVIRALNDARSPLLREFTIA
jgi:glutathione S-transferase